jgi:hypothetical protein
MSAERRIAAFFDLADRGLKSAETLFRDGQFEDAAYFAQQIVERLARALLTKAGIPFWNESQSRRARSRKDIPSNHASMSLTASRPPRRSIDIRHRPDGCPRRRISKVFGKPSMTSPFLPGKPRPMYMAELPQISV